MKSVDMFVPAVKSNTIIVEHTYSIMKLRCDRLLSTDHEEKLYYADIRNNGNKMPNRLHYLILINVSM